ncbi:MAG: hypothetical protein M1813_009312 [Trichoglossum hirsutum]|nr:MAG: hypothetical protein M1813_009312 [Trichoglossum hirsutum]
MSSSYEGANLLIEVDRDVPQSTADSGLTDMEAQELRSIETRITQYKWENGRRYHAYREGHYPMPNDEMENNRLDMKHHIILLMLDGRLHISPLPLAPRILDVGTGTGIWAMDMADKYPDGQVIGTDLSPIQPTWVPPNCYFEVDDAESTWVRDPDSFDFVHVRFMWAGIRDYPKLVRQAMKALKPGGYIELMDHDLYPICIDDTMKPDNPLLSFCDHMVAAGKEMGLNFLVPRDFKNILRDAGYEDVTEVIKVCPLNTWPKDPRLKEIGLFQREQALEGLSGIGIGLFTRGLGWSLEQVEVFNMEVSSSSPALPLVSHFD